MTRTTSSTGTISAYFLSNMEKPRITNAFGERDPIRGTVMPGARGKWTTTAMPKTGTAASRTVK